MKNLLTAISFIVFCISVAQTTGEIDFSQIRLESQPGEYFYSEYGTSDGSGYVAPSNSSQFGDLEIIPNIDYNFSNSSNRSFDPGIYEDFQYEFNDPSYDQDWGNHFEFEQEMPGMDSRPVP